MAPLDHCLIVSTDGAVLLAVLGEADAMWWAKAESLKILHFYKGFHLSYVLSKS